MINSIIIWAYLLTETSTTFGGLTDIYCSFWAEKLTAGKNESYFKIVVFK